MIDVWHHVERGVCPKCKSECDISVAHCKPQWKKYFLCDCHERAVGSSTNELIAINSDKKESK